MLSIKVSIRKAYERLEKENSRIIATAYGNAEYFIHDGQGIPILIAHGIVGGYDQAIQTGIGLIGEKHCLIGVSRFGYLKSDLPEEPTPENQANVYDEILNILNIKEVFLLATSAGGTPALKFALLYPDRVKGIILVGSGAPSKKKTKGPLGPPAFVYNDFIFSFLINKMESTMLSMFGVTKEQFINAGQPEKEGLRDLFKTILPIKPRRAGIFNDEKITNPDMNKNFEKYPVYEIEKPFLILHANNDPMAKQENIMEMVMVLKKVEFIQYENGGHILFGHGEQNRRHIIDFMNKNL